MQVSSYDSLSQSKNSKGLVYATQILKSENVSEFAAIRSLRKRSKVCVAQRHAGNPYADLSR
jgi:hypothetical protein